MHCPKTRRVAFALILAAFAISRAAVGGESDPKASSDSGEFFPLAKMNAGVGVDDLRQRWYSKHLAAMHEPSLWDLSKRPKKSGEAYRFLWLRTFDEPVAIRVEKATDGAARLYTRVLDGKGGYAQECQRSNPRNPSPRMSGRNFPGSWMIVRTGCCGLTRTIRSRGVAASKPNGQSRTEPNGFLRASAPENITSSSGNAPSTTHTVRRASTAPRAFSS